MTTKRKSGGTKEIKQEEHRSRDAAEAGDEQLSRRELLKRSGSYSVAVLGLMAGAGSNLACSEFVSCGVGDDCVCDDVCGPDNQWVGDGLCDDGGAGADYISCDHGADCTDCGVRAGGGYSNYSNYSDYSNYSNYSDYSYSNYSYSNYSYTNYSYYNAHLNSW